MLPEREDQDLLQDRQLARGHGPDLEILLELHGESVPTRRESHGPGVVFVLEPSELIRLINVQDDDAVVESPRAEFVEVHGKSLAVWCERHSLDRTHQVKSAEFGAGGRLDDAQWACPSTRTHRKELAVGIDAPVRLPFPLYCTEFAVGSPFFDTRADQPLRVDPQCPARSSRGVDFHAPTPVRICGKTRSAHPLEKKSERPR
jgi:hypothetical protein